MPADRVSEAIRRPTETLPAIYRLSDGAELIYLKWQATPAPGSSWGGTESGNSDGFRACWTATRRLFAPLEGAVAGNMRPVAARGNLIRVNSSGSPAL